MVVKMIIQAVEEDGHQIHAINISTGIFTDEEIECVDELWVEYQTLGSETSGYYFLVDKEKGIVRGYSCFGPRALTERTYDLYWIAVDSKIQRGGVGKSLLTASEEAVRKLGGRLLVVETSGLDSYQGTRAFYLANGYVQEAVLRDFYSDGDDLIIYTRHL
jgi:ribosomal protein S18 acetylase RimI-like enzyme